MEHVSGKRRSSGNNKRERQDRSEDEADLRARLRECEQQRRRLMSKYCQLWSQWEAIEASRGYRLLQRLYAIRLWLCPRGSRRERFAERLLCRLSSPSLPAAQRSCLNRSQLRATHIASLDGDATRAGGNSESDDATGDASELDWLDKVSCAPLSWQGRPQTPHDHRSLDMVILSLLPRSGSTLLQRICNARKGTLIWGEHDGALSYFAEVYQSIAGFSQIAGCQRDEYFQGGENPNTWIANMCPSIDHVEQAVVDSVRTLLGSLYGASSAGHDMIGFKEVRYGRAELELLRRCYPNLTILLLTRNPYDTRISTPRDWYPSVEQWAELWSDTAREFVDAAESDPLCHLIRYEDLVERDPKTLALLSDVAQVPLDGIAKVLKAKIGSSRMGISDVERRVITRCCRDSMRPLNYPCR